MTFRRVWGPLALSVGVSVTAGVCAANAQTVQLRNATPGAAVELVLNTARVAAGTADAQGNAVLVVPPTTPKTTITERHIFVDECGNMRRVLIVDAGLQPAAPDTLCQRTAVPDLFEIRPITTLVVEASSGHHPILISQGPAPEEWMRQPGPGEDGGIVIVRRPLPRGIVLSVGGTGMKYAHVVTVACGDNTTACSGQNLQLGFSAGAAVWLTHIFGIEATYMKPVDAKTSGSGTNFTFNSIFQAQIVTLAAKVGIQAGPTRFYALGGVNRAFTTASTTQTVTGTSTALGGTETFQLKTAGWGVLAGGGWEAWMSHHLAIYIEGGYAPLKGSAVKNGDGTLDDSVTYATVGLRLHVGP